MMIRDFIWSEKGQTHTISSKDIHDVVNDELKVYLESLVARSEPIFSLGKPHILITGESSVIEGMPEHIEKVSETEVEKYSAMTFGIKDPSFSALAGAFYYYKDLPSN